MKEKETKRREDMAAAAAKAAAKAKKKGAAASKNEPTTKTNRSRTSVSSASSDDDMASPDLAVVASSKVATVKESVERPFAGAMEDIDLEMNISVCKLFLQVLEKITRGSMGVQSLKNVWHNKSLMVKFKRERAAQFLDNVTTEYIHSRQTNFVHKTWARLRRIEAMELKLAQIAETRRQRLEMIGYQLEWIPRYGWREEMDDLGYSYWVDDVKYQDNTYEMPRYTLQDWNAACRIQWTAGRFLLTVYEKKRQRELARLEALANHEKLMLEEFGRTQRSITVSVGITKRLLSAVSTVDTKQENGTFSPESFLPFKLKFVDTVVFKTHEWVLVRFDEDPPTHKVAIILKYSKSKMKYDVRLVSGTIVKGILPVRLSKMNYDIGTRVEARFKGAALFYRGVITAIQTSLTSNDYEYSIKYDDGEKEVRVPRSLIRPDPREVAHFFQERARLLKFFEKREQRAVHIANIRKERLLRVAMEAKVCPSGELDIAFI